MDASQIPNALMQYSIGLGTQRRTYTSPELGILQDLGYTLTVPEPSTLSIGLISIATIAVYRRRRQR